MSVKVQAFKRKSAEKSVEEDEDSGEFEVIEESDAYTLRGERV